MDTTQRRTKLLFSKLARNCSELLENPAPGRVHQFRTTLRRIESAIGAASITLTSKDKKLLHQLELIRKRAGKVRDIDVQVEALSTLSIDRGFQHKKQLQTVLDQKRKRRAAKLSASVAAFTESLPKVSRIAKKLSTANGVGASEKVDFIRLAKDQWSQAVLKHDLNSNRITPDDLHEFRLDMKRVRYTAEMAESIVSQELISQAKRIQDAIGAWRDFANLTESAERELQEYQSSALVSLLKNVTGAKLVTAMRTSIDVTNEMFSPVPLKKSPDSVHLVRSSRKVMLQR